MQRGAVNGVDNGAAVDHARTDYPYTITCIEAISLELSAQTDRALPGLVEARQRRATAGGLLRQQTLNRRRFCASLRPVTTR